MMKKKKEMRGRRSLGPDPLPGIAKSSLYYVEQMGSVQPRSSEVCVRAKLPMCAQAISREDGTSRLSQYFMLIGVG